VPGDMRIYEMPSPSAIRTCFNNDPDRPMDTARGDASAVSPGPDGEVFLQIIRENLDELERRDQRSAACSPPATTRTSTPIAARFSIAIWCASVRRLRRWRNERGYTFIPSSFAR